MRLTTPREQLLARAESEHALDTAVRSLIQDLERHPCTCAADPRRCKKANHAAAARRNER